MCERKEKCQEGEEDESDSDDEGQFDVDHFDSVNRNRNGIERGSSDTGGADSLSYVLLVAKHASCSGQEWSFLKFSFCMLPST